MRRLSLATGALGRSLPAAWRLSSPSRSVAFRLVRTRLTARLDPKRFAGHLRVLRWVGHVTQPVALVAFDPLEQWRQIVRYVVDRDVRIADLGDARRHGREVEVVRFDVG